MQTQRILKWVWKCIISSVYYHCQLIALNTKMTMAVVFVSLLVMDIADLSKQLKRAQTQANKTAKINANGLSACFLPTVMFLM